MYTISFDMLVDRERDKYPIKELKKKKKRIDFNKWFIISKITNWINKNNK